MYKYKIVLKKWLNQLVTVKFEKITKKLYNINMNVNTSNVV